MAPPRRSPQVLPATPIHQPLLDVIADLQRLSASDSKLFPNGIDFLHVKIRAAGVEFEITLAGPDSRPERGRLRLDATTPAAFAAPEPVLVLLPQVSGNGYYPYSKAARQYGTPAAIRAVVDVGGQWQINMPSTPFGVGDISLAAGGQMPPHDGHREGRNVDVRPMRTDGRPEGVRIGDAAYSRDHTALLIASFFAHESVASILFNDASIPGVKPYPGHDDHFHVTMKG